MDEANQETRGRKSHIPNNVQKRKRNITMSDATYNLIVAQKGDKTVSEFVEKSCIWELRSNNEKSVEGHWYFKNS